MLKNLFRPSRINRRQRGSARLAEQRGRGRLQAMENLENRYALAADLQVTPITWDIIGLDSNKPTVSGPDTFLVGARITNSGDQSISGVTANFTLGDTVKLNANDQWAKIANTYINAIGPTTTQSSYTIAPGQWVDVFFGVKIDRTKAAYTTARRYDITATNGTITDSLTDDPTDHTRQLYVERLVSQNRNATTNITVTKSGTNVVSASPGELLTIVHRTKSAPGGYEVTVNELTLPNDVFEIISTTSAPLQTTFSSDNTNRINSPTDTIWLDASGWRSDPDQPDNLTLNPTYSTATDNQKAGGRTMQTTYQVRVRNTAQAGTYSLTGIIYDYSGSSYHYNADTGIVFQNFTVVSGATIGDRVWKDDNGNARQDSGEQGVPGVQVDLRKASDNSLVATTFTDGSGNYYFDSADGTQLNTSYYVQFVKPAGTNFVTQNAGGGQNPTLTDSDANQTTGRTGNFTLTAGAPINLDIDAGLTYTPASVTGFIWGDTNGNGLQDGGETARLATVQLFQVVNGQPVLVRTFDTITSGGSAGQYSFTNLAPGNYFVRATPIDDGTPATAGLTLTNANIGTNDNIDSDVDPFTNVTSTFSLSAGQTADFDAGLVLGANVLGTIWYDANKDGLQGSTATEPGVAGVTVELLSDSGTVVRTVVTNVTGTFGEYLFDLLPPATGAGYSVRITPPAGYTVSPANVGANDNIDSDFSTTTFRTDSFFVPPGSTIDRDAGIYVAPPDAFNDSRTTPLNTPVGIQVLNNDIYALLTGVTLQTQADPTKGTATYNDNGTPLDPTDDYFVFTPANNYVGVATFTYTITDKLGQTDTATVTVTIFDPANPTLSADLSITKTDGVSVAIPGDDITYTIVVSNSGPNDVTGATVNDTIPGVITGATWTVAYSAGSSGVTSGSGSISNAVVNLLNGGTATFTVTGMVAASATGTLTNTATVTAPTGYVDPNLTNNSATDVDTLLPTADLFIFKTDDQATDIPGTSITYTITVTNVGPSDVAGALVNDPIPASITNVTWSAVYSSGSSGTTSGTGSLVNVPVDLLSGGTATFTVTGVILASATGTLTNTASVSTPAGVIDPDFDDNTSTDTTLLVPSGDLSVTKTDGKTTVIPGQSNTYTIVVANSGPSDVTGAVVNDPFPAAFTNATWTAVYSSGSSGAPSGSGSISGLTINLLSGGTATFTVTGTVASSATGSLVNTVTVTAPSTFTDTDLTDNSATDTDTLVPTGDLSITKTDNRTSATPGQSTTYTIVVTNAGPSDVTGATINDAIPASITNVTWTVAYSVGSNGTASGSGSLTNVPMNLLSGGTATITVNGTITQSATGTVTNTATVTAPAGFTDPTPGNNSATDTTVLNPTVDLSITKTDLQLTDVPGTSIAYTIVVANAGPSDAIGATVTDLLPASITGATWSAVYSSGSTGAASGSGSLAGVVVNLLSGGTATITVTGTIAPSATGVLTNTATVAPPAGATDSNPNNNSATDTTTLVPTGDLSITKTDNQSTDSPGSSITYTIVVSNSGTSDVTGALLNDAIPSSITNVTWSAVYSAGSSGASSGFGSLANVPLNLLSGGTATFTVTGTILGSATGTITNTATVTAPAGFTDPTPGNNSATDDTALILTADLSVTKTDNQTTDIPGTSITYTIVVSNGGPCDVTGATVTDIVPSTITGVRWSAVYTTGSSGQTSGTGSISGLAVNLLSGGQAIFTVTGAIDPTASGTLTNTATVAAPIGVTDPTPSNNSATDTTDLVPTGDLSITKTDNRTTAIPGQATSYTIVVTNSGPSTVTGALVNDTLPGSLTNATWSAIYSTGSSGVASGSGSLSGVPVNLVAGGTAIFTINATIASSATGTLSNTATVTAPTGFTDPTPGNNTSTDPTTLTPVADLSITKTDFQLTDTPGTSITYTIVVTNNGPSDVAGATVTDILPASITGATWTVAYSTGSSGTTGGSGSLSAASVNLLSGGTATITVSGTIAASATGTLTNTATIAVPSGVTDPTLSNNSATDETVLLPTADLRVTKTDNQTTDTPGTSITYTIVVTNAGPSDVSGATLTDVLPDAITAATWTALYSSGSNGVTSGSGSLAGVSMNLLSGGTATFTVIGTILASATGTLTNTATVATPSGVTDPTLSNNSATDTTTLVRAGDLTITKTDNQTTDTPGTSIAYTIVVTNAGPSDVTGALVDDALPVTITGATWTVAYSAGSSGVSSGSGSITGAAVNLLSGGTATFTVSGMIVSTATGTLTNTATVTAPTGYTDTNPANNSATDTTALVPVADLTITKTDNQLTDIPGTSITYTIVVSNNGPSNVTGATLNDTLPAEIQAATWTASYSTGSTGPLSGIGSIADAPLTLLSGGSATFTVTGVIASFATGTLTNTATVTPPSGTIDPTPSNNSATDTTSLVPTGDLSITKTDNKTTLTAGDATTYTIIVINAGPSFVTRARVIDTLPDVLLNATWTASFTGVGSIGTSSGAGSIDQLVNLAAGGTATYTVTATVASSASGTLTNTATVAAPDGFTDPTPVNNSATDTTTIVAPPPQAILADLAITKTDNQTTDTAGTSITYSIVVSNNGPSAVTGATVNDILPASITGATWSAIYSSGSSGQASGSGSLSGVVMNLLAGGTATITVTGTILASATGTLSNTATVSVPSGYTDPTPANNSATDITTLVTAADLSITKTDGRTSAAPGTATTYTIVVTNSGPSDVNGATVSDGLPAAYSNATWTAAYSAGSSGPTSGAGPISGVSVNLLSSGTATFTITGTILSTATGTLSNTATVAPPAGVTDPTPGNNSATDTTTLTPTGDLSITKTDSLDTITAGSLTTYTIVVTNAGPSFATGARVVDTLPASLTSATWTATFLGAGSTGATSGSGNINQTISLAAGGSAIYTVSATVSPSATGSIVNTATVTAPTGFTDPTPSNNSATDTTTIDPQRSLIPPIADLKVTKTDNQTTDTPGTSITYTIVVTNDGPDAVTGATLTDVLPSTITDAAWTAFYTTGSSGATSGSGSLAGVSMNLLAGGSATFTINGMILASATGTLSNTATVTVPTGFTDPTPGNNSATDTTDLAPAGDLSITKTDNQTTEVPGTSITYTIVASNAGPSDVTGALVNDPIPATITNVSWTAVYSSGSTGVANGTGSLSNVAVNLLSGGTATFTVTGMVAQSARGTLSNTATVTAPTGFTDLNSSNNSATDVDTLVPTADLSITKTDNRTAAVPGTANTYTIVVTNNGPTDVTGATVTDGLPATLTGATWTAVYSTGSSGTASGTGSISGVAVNLLSGGTATFTVNATIAPTATGTLTNTATVTAPAGFTDPTPGNNAATDNTTLTPQANLSLTKSNGATSVVPGTNTTYTFTVTNAGPSTATGATVRDTLPAGTTFVSATNGATYDAANNRVNFTAGTLAPNGTTSFTVTLAVGAGLTGTLTNSATVSPPPGVTDPDSTNDTGTDTDTLTPTGDLSITKTDNKTSAVPGTLNTYTIVVTNNGPSNVTGATVTDGLPATLTNASWTAVYSTGSTGAASGTGSISGVAVNLLSGGTATFTVNATIAPSATGTLTNTATVTAPSGFIDPTPGNNAATDNTTLTPQANLSLTKSNGATSVVPGSNTTYTITVTNAGPSEATGATVRDTLPTGMTFVSATNGATYDAANNRVNFTAGTLAPNGTTSFTVTLAVGAGLTGSLANSATVSPPPGVTDPDPSNDTGTDTDTLTPTGDLSITKTDNKTTAVPGTLNTYTIVVTNNGPSNVTGASVTDGLPATLTGASWTAVYSTGSSGATSGSGAMSGVAVNLLSGGTATFTVNATIAPSATGTLTNTATVTAPSGFTDPTPGNNSATDNTTLTPQANLSLTKSNGASSVVPGANTTYTLTVTNAGPITVTGATVRDTLPTGATFVSATNGATYDAANNRVNFTAGTLAPNGTTSFTVTLAVGAGLTGSLTNSATVSPPPGVTDPDPSNDTGTDTDTLTPTGDLSITKTDNKSTAVPGTLNTYTIVVTNNGPSNVTGASVTDGLPATLTGASWTAVYSTGSTGAASGSGAMSGVAVNLLSGGTATFTVNATIAPSATGTLTNTATVTAPNGFTDPTPGNNSATDNTTLTPQANLSLTKTNGVTSVRSGSQVTYTFTVTNAGPNQVTGATVTDTLPTGMTFVSATGGAVYDAATRTVVFTTGTLVSNNGTATFTTTVTINATSGTISNDAVVAPPPGVVDPTPGNNTATDTDDVSPNTILVATNDVGCDNTYEVFVLDPATGEQRGQFAAYEVGFRGGLRATIADIDGDGADEIITAPGRGRVGEIRVFEQDGTELVGYRTQPFGSRYVNGLDVAVGDVDGDGDLDIVAAMASGGSTVAVFRNNPSNVSDPIENVAFRSFVPFNRFLGGATVAIADMGTFNGGRITDARTLDQRAEIIVGSGSGMAPTVLIYDVSSTPAVIDRIAALSPTLRSGVSVSTARFNSDDIPDIVVAAGRNGGSTVEVYDGTVARAANARLARQSAFAALGKANGAVFAAMADINGNGVIDDGEVFATQGDGGAQNGIRRMTRAGATQSTLSGSPRGPLRIVASPRR